MVLGHKTGLGKTFISLLAWAQWSDVRRALIVGSASSIGTWKRIIKEWGGAECIIMKGSGDPAWADVMSKKSGIWMCTYATYRILMKSVPKPKHIHVDLLINDELHKALRNKTLTHSEMRRCDSTYYIGCTATWASKGPQDLWPVLNLIDHKFFSSYWRFVGTWCIVEDASFGKEILGAKNPDKLKILLANNYYRSRTWKEVGHQFLKHELKDEPIVRRIETVDMTPDQAILYDGMDSRMEARYQGQMVLAQNSLAKLTKLLQLALCPALLFKDGPIGGAAEYLVERLLSLESAVVFIPFKDLAPLVGVYLLKSGYTKPVYTLYGGTTTEDCDYTIEQWRKTGGVVFCTVSYAQSFALDATDHAFFLGFDWDPNNNIQAEGRLRRFDSDFIIPCLATYIVVANTVYEAVKDVINGKIRNVQTVLAGYGL